MNRSRIAAPLVLIAALLVSACSGQVADRAGDGAPAGGEVPAKPLDAAAEAAAAAAEAAASGDAAASTDDDYAGLIARISSCDGVAEFVAPYIVGFEALPSNSVDEFGAFCVWEAPPGGEFSDIASVSVSIAPSATNEIDSLADLEAAGVVVLPDPAIESVGGIAYGVGTVTSVAAVTVTAIRVPGIDIDITGGQWGDYPALDGPAAVEVGKEILGLG